MRVKKTTDACIDQRQRAGVLLRHPPTFRWFRSWRNGKTKNEMWHVSQTSKPGDRDVCVAREPVMWHLLQLTDLHSGSANGDSNKSENDMVLWGLGWFPPPPEACSPFEPHFQASAWGKLPTHNKKRLIDLQFYIIWPIHFLFFSVLWVLFSDASMEPFQGLFVHFSHKGPRWWRQKHAAGQWWTGSSVRDHGCPTDSWEELHGRMKVKSERRDVGRTKTYKQTQENVSSIFRYDAVDSDLSCN